MTYGETCQGYLITLSARPSTLCGMVTPICFAVLRLITSSNFVGCCTGRSAGLAPFRISHRRNNAMGGVKWESLWQGAVVRHKVPGKDSGDMLSGENARLLAKLLAERL